MLWLFIDSGRITPGGMRSTFCGAALSFGLSGSYGVKIGLSLRPVWIVSLAVAVAAEASSNCQYCQRGRDSASFRLWPLGAYHIAGGNLRLPFCWFFGFHSRVFWRPADSLDSAFGLLR